MISTPRRAKQFRLTDRSLNPLTGHAAFCYELDGHSFQEVVRIPPGDARQLPALDLLLDVCHIVIGTSYFKLGAPRNIFLRPGGHPLAEEILWQTYDDGLREFALANHLEIPLQFEICHRDGDSLPMELSRLPTRIERPLVPIGGGKDSAAVLLMLPGATGVAISPTAAHRRLASEADVPLIEVHRALDPRLGDLTPTGYNGHVPVTAINSALSALVAYMHGFDAVVMGNERSANETTRDAAGAAINHQHSKSFEYEVQLHNILEFAGINYFSLLRELTELNIAGIVASSPELRGSILSCNRAFKRDRLPASAQGWCLECPKCLFTFLCFAPFLNVSDARGMFSGVPVDDSARAEGFSALWSKEAKPFDCVGERAEAAVAMAWLGRLPEWRDRPVVGALAAEAEEVARSLGATLTSVLTPAGSHLIPAAAHRLVRTAALRVLDGDPVRYET